MARSVQLTLSPANAIFNMANRRGTSGLTIIAIVFTLLSSIGVYWKLIFTSFLLTCYYYSYFITSSFRLPRPQDLSSEAMRFIAKRALHITILAGFIMWCISMTPIHIPTFIGAFTPYAIYEPLRVADVVYDAGKNAVVDVFVIHGLGSQSDSAWFYNPNSTRVRWLSELLPRTEGLHNIRVIDVNYQTRWDLTTVHMNFQDYASDLLGHVETEHKTHPNRPILFIAHSISGILLKKALLLAKSNSMDVAAATTAIVFLGVPHRGTRATIESSRLPFMRFSRGSPSTTLEFMSFNNYALLDLESEFYDAYVLQHHLNEKQPYICDILESQPESGFLRHGRVITLNTGRPGLDKFQSINDPNFQAFQRIIKQAISHVLPDDYTAPRSTHVPDILDYASYGLPWVAKSRITAAVIGGLEEVAASWMAGDRNKHGNYMTARCPKMMLYRGIVAVPVSHGLAWAIRKAFEGYTSTTARLLQILFGNITIVPLQIIIDMLAKAYIAGARTSRHFCATAKLGLRIHAKLYFWMAPLALFIAHRFLPQAAWTRFLNLALFLFYTSGNTMIKKKRLNALRKKRSSNGSVGKIVESSSAENDTPPAKTPEIYGVDNIGVTEDASRKEPGSDIEHIGEDVG